MKKQNFEDEKKLFEIFLNGDYKNLADQQKANQIVMKDKIFFAHLKEVIEKASLKESQKKKPCLLD